MMRGYCGKWRVLTIAAGALSLAAGAAAQATQTKETVPGGPTTTAGKEVKGEVVAVGSSWLIAQNPAGECSVYRVKAGRKFTIDGVSKTLSELKRGTMLTAHVTTTETPIINRTTTITQGTVFWASPKSIIVTLEGGESKQYEVPEGFKFSVNGKELAAKDLKPGMKLTATKIVEEPVRVISEDVVVTGTAPK